MAEESKGTEQRKPSRRDLLLGTAAVVGGSAAAYALYKGGERLLTPRPGNELSPVSVQLPQRIYGNDAYPVWHRRPMPPASPAARYPGFRPGVTLLKKGTIRREGAMPLPCDIVFERDVAVKLRDGTTIYTDIFRPAAPGRYPAIVAWSPYGKEIGGQWFDDVAARSNVPLAAVSELQKFEAPDPAFFCNHGYVILNPDARGAYASEGNIAYWGRQNAEDGYDFIEWAAVQPWCSGKLGMGGNSWLSMSQWCIAAERPPHLAAIAPWEGNDDKYNTGGIPMPAFDEIIIQTFAGKGLVEDVPKMIAAHPFKDAYWLDKRPAVEKIEIPAYVVASYTNNAHTQGTFDGYRRLGSTRKWLRVHATQEWEDFNDPANRADLLRFFDHVLKGIDNSWDATPKVRLSVLDPGHADVTGRPEAEWPLARQRHVPLYLHPDEGMSTRPGSKPANVRYETTDAEGVSFLFAFDRDTEITGYMSVRLWVEAVGSNDMDLTFAVEKVDADGKSFPTPYYMPPGQHPTANAKLRVSHRELDAALSTPVEPVQLHQREVLLKPGEIVPIDVTLWPLALMCHAGEKLRLTVSPHGAGKPFHFPWDFGAAKIDTPANGGTFTPGSHPETVTLGGPSWTKPDYVAQQVAQMPPARNKGSHVIHFGGSYDSHLLIPVIPT